MMQKVHPYKHIAPHKIDILSGRNMSYTIDHYGEDEEIRLGFGVCGKVERSHVKVVEVDYSWLGVVFHIVSTSECENGTVKRIKIVKNDLNAVKAIAREIVLDHITANPLCLEGFLNLIHNGSREQGQLEIIKHSIAAMNTEVDFSED